MHNPQTKAIMQWRPGSVCVCGGGSMVQGNKGGVRGDICNTLKIKFFKKKKNKNLTKSHYF